MLMKTRTRGTIPPFVAPQLATLVDAVPAEGAWLHEIKFDGYRVMASIGGGQAVLRTRKGFDWTDKFAPLVEPLLKLPCSSALLDGEVAVADAKGRTDFGALQNALSTGNGNFAYYVFDLLHLDGEDLRPLPLLERKRRLQALLARARRPRLRFTDHVSGRGAAFYEQACRRGLEGVVAKRADSPYRSARGRDWLKIRCGKRQEFAPHGGDARSLSHLLRVVRPTDAARAGRAQPGAATG